MAGLAAFWAVGLAASFMGNLLDLAWIYRQLLRYPAIGVWAIVVLPASAILGWLLRRVAGMVVASVATAALMMVSWQSVSQSPREWFEDHRSDYEAAAAISVGDDYYGVSLPSGLSWLSVDGHMAERCLQRCQGADPVTARFFPMWMGIPDDAGGFIHSPDVSPDGLLDMYGMPCEDPTDLRDGWWMCGMAD